MKTIQQIAIVFGLLGVVPAGAHEIAWSAGASRVKGVGHCAKGPCQKRASFDATVPHRHLGEWKCVGQGAGGYRFGSRFNCPGK